MVRYTRKNRHLYYVACVENVNEETGLILPDDEDSESVDRSDIDRVLPQPRSVGGTARVALKLRFNTNLDNINKSQFSKHHSNYYDSTTARTAHHDSDNMLL